MVFLAQVFSCPPDSLVCRASDSETASVLFMISDARYIFSNPGPASKPFLLPMVSSFLLITLVTAFALPSALASTSLIVERGNQTALAYTCNSFYVPVNISAETVAFNLSAPNQAELTDIVTRLAYLNSTVAAELATGSANIETSYSMYSELCIPQNFEQNGTIEFAIHGLGFDHTYWNFEPGSQYNYAEAAIKAGHAIFMYDRLGTGNSSKPDGIQEAQLSTEVEIAAALVAYLRKGYGSTEFGRVIGVGHSYGSVQLITLAAKHGNVVDASVLTGVSAFPAGLPAVFAAFNLHIASRTDPTKYAKLDSSYTLSGGKSDDQIVFFKFPHYASDVFDAVESDKGLITIGQVLTIADGFVVAENFTNPVLVVTGDSDFPFCGGQCEVPDGNFTSRPADVEALFPSASSFSTYIPPDTGHGVNVHFSAPQTFSFIEKWIGEVFEIPIHMFGEKQAIVKF